MTLGPAGSRSHMSNSIRRTERVLDLASLGSIIGGFACYARSYLAMQVLQGGKLVPGAASHSAMQQFAYFRNLSEVGLGLVVLGVAIGVGSVFVNRRAAARPAAAPSEQPARVDIRQTPIAPQPAQS